MIIDSSAVIAHADGWVPAFAGMTTGAGSGPPLRSRRHGGCEIVDRRLGTALAMRNAECRERHLDHAQRAHQHRRVDMAHMGDAERLALELADTEAHMKRGLRGGFRRENTTLIVVATNARLTKVEAAKLAALPGWVSPGRFIP